MFVYLLNFPPGHFLISRIVCYNLQHIACSNALNGPKKKLKNYDPRFVFPTPMKSSEYINISPLKLTARTLMSETMFNIRPLIRDH